MPERGMVMGMSYDVALTGNGRTCLVPAAPQSVPRWQVVAVSFVAVAVAILALHWRYLGYGWQHDDYDFLQFLPREPWHWALVPRHWFYRPVFLLYFRCLWPAGPVAMHAASLALHIANATLLGWIVWRLTRSRFAALAASALFLLAPGKQEAIYWVSSASTLLATLFLLLCLHCWLWYRAGNRPAYWAALVAFALALCSKEDALGLPLMLLALEVYRGTDWRRSYRYLPFALVMACYCLLELRSVRLMRLWGDMAPYDAQGDVASGGLRATAALCYVALDRATAGAVAAMAPGALILLLAIWARQRKFGLLLLALLVAAVLPVPLLLGRASVIASRFCYVPQVFGCAALAAWCATQTPGVWRWLLAGALLLLVLPLPTAPRDPGFTLPAAFLVLCVAAGLVYLRVADWRLCAAVAALTLASQIELFLPLPVPHGWHLVAALAGAAMAPCGQRMTALSALLLWPMGNVYSLPALLVAGLPQKLILARRAQYCSTALRLASLRAES